MSHRFDQDKTTLRQIIRSGALGAVSVVSCRYYSDMRGHLDWACETGRYRPDRSVEPDIRAGRSTTEATAAP